MIYAILCRRKVPGTAVCRIKPTMGKAVKYNRQSHICIKCFATQTMGNEPPRFECLVEARSLTQARNEVKTADAAFVITHRCSYLVWRLHNFVSHDLSRVGYGIMSQGCWFPAFRKDVMPSY
jgi:ribosomal protein L40E